MNGILALARITYKEGIRNRSVLGIVFFSLFIFSLNVAVAGFFMREIGKVTVDMNLGALSFSGLLLVLFVGLNLMAKDIDRKTIHLVLSKPITRIEYLWGKFIGILAFVLVSQVFLLVLSCATIYLLLFLYPNYFFGFSWGMYFLACLFIYLKLALLSAIVVFFSSVTTSAFVTLIFSICIYLVGVTVEEAVFYIRSGLAVDEVPAILNRVLEVISYLVPNFSAFDFKLQAAHGLTVPLTQLLLVASYGVTYVVVLLLLASVIFRRREFN